MAFTHNEQGKITIPRADSVTLNVMVEGGGVQDGDAVLFRVRAKNDHTQWAFTKIATISGGVATIRLSSEDTKTFVAGRDYGWTIGIISGLDYDDNGNPVANDEGDMVVTAHNAFKVFDVAESGILSIDE